MIQFRYRLIPYIYSMSHLIHLTGQSLVTPLYHFHPKEENSYLVPNQYYFGTELIVAPFVTPIIPDTGLSRAVVWIPTGKWFSFYEGHVIPSGWFTVHGRLEEVPVFAKAGAIVPLALGDTSLEVHFFPGADNSFHLFEDAEDTLDYLEGAGSITILSQKCSSSTIELRIGKSSDQKFVPSKRKWSIVLWDTSKDDIKELKVFVNGEERKVEQEFNPKKNNMRFEVETQWDEEVEVTVEKTPERKEEDLQEEIYFHQVNQFRRKMRNFSALSDLKDYLATLPKKSSDVEEVFESLASLRNDPQTRVLLEMILGCGSEEIKIAKESLRKVILWNRFNIKKVTYRVTRDNKGQEEYLQVPSELVIDCSDESVDYVVEVEYAHLLSQRYHFPGKKRKEESSKPLGFFAKVRTRVNSWAGGVNK